MLTDYLPDDVLQYVVNEYMSHHPDDMKVLNMCVRDGFIFRIEQYTLPITKYNPYNDNVQLHSLQVDGYVAVYTEYNYSGRVLHQVSRKYGELHGRLTKTTWAGCPKYDGTFVHGVPHGVQYMYMYDDLHTNVYCERHILDYDMGQLLTPCRLHFQASAKNKFKKYRHITCSGSCDNIYDYVQ